MRRLKRAGLPGLHLYYDAWQRLAAIRARGAGSLGRLRSRPPRDLRHVLDPRWSERAGQAVRLGPGGWRCEHPRPSFRELGVAGLARRGPPCGGAPPRECGDRVSAPRREPQRVCLVQNRSTARRLRQLACHCAPERLSRATAAAGPAGARGTDIAFVGRLIPWKGGPPGGARHASRAARRRRPAHLRDGPDRQRIRRAAAAVGAAGPRRAGGQRAPRRAAAAGFDVAGCCSIPPCTRRPAWASPRR